VLDRLTRSKPSNKQRWTSPRPLSNSRPRNPAAKLAELDLAAVSDLSGDGFPRREFVRLLAPAARSWDASPVFRAPVLFLVGISGHFALRGASLALVGIGVALLVFSVAQLLGLAPPP